MPGRRPRPRHEDAAFTDALGLVIVLIALAGGGRAVLAVSANTMLQRVVPAQLVGRVFGIVEGLSMAGLAAGALLTPLLVGLGGARLALIAVGGLLPVTALCGLRTLRRLDQGLAGPVTEVALLRSLPHFADLPGQALETLAGALERVDVAPGQVLIRQGDDGDRFYAIADGEMAVSVDGRPGGCAAGAPAWARSPCCGAPPARRRSPRSRPPPCSRWTAARSWPRSAGTHPPGGTPTRSRPGGPAPTPPRRTRP